MSRKADKKTAAEKSANPVAEALNGILADTLVLYMKTHAAHWNVEGLNFHSLHLLFQDQYNEQWLALDVLAERIRALGGYAPHSLAEILKRTALKEDKDVGSASELLAGLLASQEALLARLRKVVALAENSGDAVSAGMLLTRTEAHEKQAWMLRASLK